MAARAGPASEEKSFFVGGRERNVNVRSFKRVDIMRTMNTMMDGKTVDGDYKLCRIYIRYTQFF